MPGYFSGYELPTPGSTTPNYLSYAGITVKDLPAGTDVTGIPTFNKQDGSGLRIDSCCTPGIDCLRSDPTTGWYNTGGLSCHVLSLWFATKRHSLTLAYLRCRVGGTVQIYGHPRNLGT